MAMKIITGYTGEKHITPIDDARLHKALFGNGDYVLPTGSQLAATIETATEISIADGELVMQGRYARNDSTQSLAISNGSQGMNRNDLIVARYTKNTITSVESVDLVVITGAATSGTAADPEYNKGDIENGETKDFPLYRVRLNGVAIEAVEQLWVMPTITGISTDTPEEVLQFLGGTNITKLWQNASPTSSFAEQEVLNIPIKGVNFIMAVFNTSTDNTRKYVAFAPVGYYGEVLRIGNVDYTLALVYLQRRFAVTTAGKLMFSDTYYKQTSNSVNNGYLIPYAVYGIKGVK